MNCSLIFQYVPTDKVNNSNYDRGKQKKKKKCVNQNDILVLSYSDILNCD